MSELSPVLLEVLACPVDHGPLLWIPTEGVLYNPRLRRAYRVVDGIPNLLVDEAELVDEERHAALLALSIKKEAQG
jgi:uncharacterized protein YbaR (Trm112 family)